MQARVLLGHFASQQYHLHACSRQTRPAQPKRHRGDLSPCGQSPMDFESISLAARTHCLVLAGAQALIRRCPRRSEPRPLRNGIGSSTRPQLLACILHFRATCGLMMRRLAAPRRSQCDPGRPRQGSTMPWQRSRDGEVGIRVHTSRGVPGAAMGDSHQDTCQGRAIGHVRSRL